MGAPCCFTQDHAAAENRTNEFQNRSNANLLFPVRQNAPVFRIFSSANQFNKYLCGKSTEYLHMYHLNTGICCGYRYTEKMTKNKNTWIGALLICLLASCSPIVYDSLWQGQPIKADGNPREWSKPLKHYDSNTKLQYTFSNDRQNMYICIRATDERTQQKLLRGGLQVWLDTTAKGKERTGLLFPLPETEAKTETSQDNYSKHNPDEYRPKKKFRSDRTEMEVKGFKAPISGVLPLQNIYGIAANINMDSVDILTYEAIIPFRSFYKDSLSPSDSSKTISIKIVLNGIPKSKDKTHGAADPGADAAQTMGSSSQAMGQGGARGGRGGAKGGSAPSDPMSESQSVKTVIKLSLQPKFRISGTPSF